MPRGISPRHRPITPDRCTSRSTRSRRSSATPRHPPRQAARPGPARLSDFVARRPSCAASVRTVVGKDPEVGAPAAPAATADHPGRRQRRDEPRLPLTADPCKQRGWQTAVAVGPRIRTSPATPRDARGARARPIQRPRQPAAARAGAPRADVGDSTPRPNARDRRADLAGRGPATSPRRRPRCAVPPAGRWSEAHCLAPQPKTPGATGRCALDRGAEIDAHWNHHDSRARSCSPTARRRARMSGGRPRASRSRRRVNARKLDDPNTRPAGPARSIRANSDNWRTRDATTPACPRTRLPSERGYSKQPDPAPTESPRLGGSWTASASAWDSRANTTDPRSDARTSASPSRVSPPRRRSRGSPSSAPIGERRDRPPRATPANAARRTEQRQRSTP